MRIYVHPNPGPQHRANIRKRWRKKKCLTVAGVDNSLLETAGNLGSDLEERPVSPGFGGRFKKLASPVLKKDFLKFGRQLRKSCFFTGLVLHYYLKVLLWAKEIFPVFLGKRRTGWNVVWWRSIQLVPALELFVRAKFYEALFHEAFGLRAELPCPLLNGG